MDLLTTPGRDRQGSTQRYRIVRRLDVGGMAEIFLGKARSMGDLEKDVAIKRILPALAADPAFVEMFLDEARLSMALNHTNIVQVFDVGKSGASWFLVMEWVDGPNLRRVLHKAKEVGYRIPVGVACYLISELCKGLNHAHTRAGPDGQSLNIVHRDVSPPNILISRSGEVKITDFGLSQAMSHSSVTEPGIVKGKFAYLAPEAAHGRALDQRADVFAAGLCLWELLAGEKLFQGADDLEVLEAVRRTRIPPLQGRHPEVTAALDEILSRALARKPEDRLASAQALANELTSYLLDQQIKGTSFEAAEMLSHLFDGGGHRPPWSERLAQLLDEEVALLDEEISGGAAPWASSGPVDIASWGLPPEGDLHLETLWAHLDRIPIEGPEQAGASAAPATRGHDLLERLEGSRITGANDALDNPPQRPLHWVLIALGLLALGVLVGVML